jgi:hypothetical protein
LENPDGLPVGFAKDENFIDPFTGEKQTVLGLTRVLPTPESAFFV